VNYWRPHPPEHGIMGNGPQKGLAFHRDWSGTVVRLKRPRVLPRSRPAGLIADAGLRWCGAMPS